MYLQKFSDLPPHGDHFPTSEDKNIKKIYLYADYEDLYTLSTIIYLRYVGRKVF